MFYRFAGGDYAACSKFVMKMIMAISILRFHAVVNLLRQVSFKRIYIVFC